MPGRLSMLVRASSIRLIRASRPPVVVRFSLLHRDRKSFMYSLPSSRSEGIGPRIVRHSLLGESEACFRDMCSLCINNTMQNASSTSPAAAAAAAPA